VPDSTAFRVLARSPRTSAAECSASGMPCSTDLRGTYPHVTLSGQEVTVGKRSIVLSLLGFVLLAVTAFGAEERIVPVIADLDGDGLREIVFSAPAKGPLAEYVFSEDGGVMKSLFLSFAPYGSNVEELVPGTHTDPEDRKRQYVEGVEFPFTLSSEGLSEGAYTLAEPRYPEPGVFEIEFVGMLGDAVVTKTYTFREDAIYTVGVRVTIENPGEPFEVSMLLGSRATMRPTSTTSTTTSRAPTGWRRAPTTHSRGSVR
jgi:hypothetical protein